MALSEGDKKVSRLRLLQQVDWHMGIAVTHQRPPTGGEIRSHVLAMVAGATTPEQRVATLYHVYGVDAVWAALQIVEAEAHQLAPAVVQKGPTRGTILEHPVTKGWYVWDGAAWLHCKDRETAIATSQQWLDEAREQQQRKVTP